MKNHDQYLNPDQIIELDKKREENIKMTYDFIKGLAQEYGLEEVNSIEELDPSPEQLKQLSYIKPGEHNSNKFEIVCYKKNLDNGEAIKICAQPSGQGNTIAAEIFSTKLGYQGHSSNHDFSYNEFKGLISKAL